MDNKIWKDIKGFEGLYAVSNWGRVKSLGNGCSNNCKERILSPGKTERGYLKVNLWKEGKIKRYSVHRLVLSTFSPVENSHELQVNHINELKDDNRLENLEWVTCKDNQNHGTRNKRISEKNTNGKCSIPIVQLTLEGKYIRSYKSSHEAEREGKFNNSLIIQCCKGKRKSHGGYKWQYLSEYMDKNCGIID